MPIRLALADIARTLAPPVFSPAQASGTLTLAAIDIYETMLCPRLSGRLRAEAPGMDIRVRPIDRSRLREHLASGEVDLAIAPPMSLPSGGAALIRRQLRTNLKGEDW
jgi:DNA-binding transcriptional LysR family regulator